MSLQQALDDCLIDFDRRVLVSDLLEEYKLTYKEAHELLEAHIKEQERIKANKYEKRFYVHGIVGNGGGELYTIVQGESKLNEWLSKLENSQSQLYSVEIAGGSKTAAPIFKPMQHVEVKLAKLEQRAGATTTATATTKVPMTNGTSKPSNGKVETIKPAAIKEEPPQASGSKAVKTPSPTDQQKKTSPSEQKGKAKSAAPPAKKGSINSFFSAAAPAAKETKAAAVNKPAAGSMDSFLKKQPTSKKSPTGSVKKESPAGNTSTQLFEVESESSSSDEEEKLDKLRRKIVDSGDESDEAGAVGKAKSASSKRRRISDSDDDEQPQKKSSEQKPKQEEEVKEEPMEVETNANQTLLDDDGFVVTLIKKKPAPSKKKTSPTAAGTAASSKSAAATKKKSPPAAGKGVKETPKGKQTNISSFFTKK